MVDRSNGFNHQAVVIAVTIFILTNHIYFRFWMLILRLIFRFLLSLIFRFFLSIGSSRCLLQTTAKGYFPPHFVTHFAPHWTFFLLLFMFPCTELVVDLFMQLITRQITLGVSLINFWFLLTLHTLVWPTNINAALKG